MIRWNNTQTSIGYALQDVPLQLVQRQLLQVVEPLLEVSLELRLPLRLPVPTIELSLQVLKRVENTIYRHQ